MSGPALPEIDKSNKASILTKARSKVEHRSMTSQLEYWATIGKAAEENPDLPFSFLKETLLAMEQMNLNPKEEYTFG